MPGTHAIHNSQAPLLQLPTLFRACDSWRGLTKNEFPLQVVNGFAARAGDCVKMVDILMIVRETGHSYTVSTA